MSGAFVKTFKRDQLHISPAPEMAAELQRLRAALQRLASMTPASINAATAAEACATVRAIAATALGEDIGA